jgi:hypothetical protein
MGPIGRNILKEWILTDPKQPFELQTTWEKKPRKTVKKMEWKRDRPLGLILDEEEEDYQILFLLLDMHSVCHVQMLDTLFVLAHCHFIYIYIVCWCHWEPSVCE